jgi:hypothetical protein
MPVVAVNKSRAFPPDGRWRGRAHASPVSTAFRGRGAAIDVAKPTAARLFAEECARAALWRVC